MNKIEIFKPFGEAYELMKRILFQPFDFKKWLVLGFAALLSGHFTGGNVNFPARIVGQRSAAIHPIHPVHLDAIRPWLPVIIIGGIAVFILLIVLLLWLKARGTFIFTDCLVHNRAAIVAPWKEFRREANSYFGFQLIFALAAMMVWGALALVVGLSVWGLNGHHWALAVVGIVVMALLFLGWTALAIFINVVFYFMPFVMYIRRCLAVDAFREVVRLIAAEPIAFILFCLFGIVLFMALIVIGFIATCATCCLAALPYVGTVILLPVFVWMRGFSLFFLRQFGPEYDVWAGNPPIFSTAPPPAAPPPLPA